MTNARSKKNTLPVPTEWHHFQGHGATCKICGCSAAALVGYKPGRRPGTIQQHRSTDGQSAAASRWEKRCKTAGSLHVAGGWKTTPIAKHRLSRAVVRDLLGHSSVSVTEQYVLDVSKHSRIRVVDVLPQPDGGQTAGHLDDLSGDCNKSQ
jgi:hypothetical protein